MGKKYKETAHKKGNLNRQISKNKTKITIKMKLKSLR